MLVIGRGSWTRLSPGAIIQKLDADATMDIGGWLRWLGLVSTKARFARAKIGAELRDLTEADLGSLTKKHKCTLIVRFSCIRLRNRHSAFG
jgi:hypothetical protein